MLSPVSRFVRITSVAPLKPSGPAVRFGRDEDLLPDAHSQFQPIRVKLPASQTFITAGYANRLSRALPRYTGPVGAEAGLVVTEWPAVQAAPKSKALETYGMLGCAAFTLEEPDDATFTFQPPKRRGAKNTPITLEPRHLIGHLTPPATGTWTPKTLHDLLDALSARSNARPWDLARSRMTLMPGLLPETMPTVHEFQRVLKQRSPNLLDKLEYVHYPADVVDAAEWPEPEPRKKIAALTPREVILAYGTSFISHLGQLSWRRTPSDNRAFTDSSHRLDRIDFDPKAQPALSLEVHTDPRFASRSVRFGSDTAIPKVSITPQLAKLGWTKQMADKMDAVLAQCQYGHRPDSLVDPLTKNVKPYGFVSLTPASASQAADKLVYLTGLAPEFKAEPPFEGTCSHLTYQVWRHLSKAPETKDLAYQTMNGLQDPYFKGGAHLYLVTWPKAIHAQVEAALTNLPLPLESADWIKSLPDGVAVIDPSFKRWAIKQADDPTSLARLKSLGLSMTAWRLFDAVDFTRPTYNTSWSLKPFMAKVINAPSNAAPAMAIRSYPLGYAAEWLPEQFAHEAGPQPPKDPTMVMLAITDTHNDVTTTDGVMALAGVMKPGRPMDVLTSILSWPPNNPLRLLLNHLNRAFARPAADHQTAYLNFMQRAATPTPDDATINLLRTLLGGQVPTDRARLALIIAMLRESGIIPPAS